MSIFVPGSRFSGQGINRDSSVRSSRSSTTTVVPLINTSDGTPLPVSPGIGGSLYYDIATKRIYYSDGQQTIPIGQESPGTTESYSITLGTATTVLPLVEQPIIGWTTAGSPTYHTLPEWNLSTGVFTAGSNEDLALTANISWSAGVSNLGNRYLRIQYLQAGTVGWVTVKEVSTQADPNMFVETTQECSVNMRLGAGDQVRVAVYHDANISLALNSSTPLACSLTGLKIYTN